MLQTKDVAFSYDGSHWMRFPDTNFLAKDAYLVLGASGSGKTTLLHILGGLLTPSEGSVHINQQDIYKLSGKHRDAFRGKHIGVIFQVPHFIKSLTVGQNVELAQHLANKNVSPKEVHAILTKLQIAHKIDSSTDELSQGEKQRLNIARALINTPKVILADEPTSALDDDNCIKVVDLLETSSKEVGATLIIVTHDNRLTSHFSNQILLS